MHGIGAYSLSVLDLIYLLVHVASASVLVRAEPEQRFARVACILEYEFRADAGAMGYF